MGAREAEGSRGRPRGRAVQQKTSHGAAAATTAARRYGPATPNVGSAWALPRNHPLWAPMDFEVKELEKETERERQEKLKKFEPPETPRHQLTPAEIAVVREKNMASRPPSRRLISWLCSFLEEGSRGAAAAATWIFRGETRRRGRDVDIPWRDAAPRPRRGYSVERRGGAAAATWIFR